MDFSLEVDGRSDSLTLRRDLTEGRSRPETPAQESDFADNKRCERINLWEKGNAV